MLAAPLGRSLRARALDNLKPPLLHAFTGDIAGDGGILVLAADLVDFVDVDDAGLRACYAAVCSLPKLEDDVFYILAYISGFSQRGGVNDGERNIEHFCQGVGKQSFAATRG